MAEAEAGAPDESQKEPQPELMVSDTTAVLTLAVALQRRCDGQIALRREGCCILGRRCSFQFRLTDLQPRFKSTI